MLTKSVNVKKNSDIQGTCLVANKPISYGDLIFRYNMSNPLVHLYETINWSEERKNRFLAFANQIGKDEWCFGTGDFKFVNHSCDPNAWWTSFGHLTARRDINSGEEITYDYSTTDIALNYNMQCLCGSSKCRGNFTNKDFLNPSFQETYAGHLPDHVVAAIKRAREEGGKSPGSRTYQLPEHVREQFRKANLDEAEFKDKYGEKYIIEMIKQLMLNK